MTLKKVFVNKSYTILKINSEYFQQFLSIPACHKRWSSIHRPSKNEPMNKNKITTINEARRFIFDCLVAVGCNKHHADIASENLVTADFRGLYNHGMNALCSLIKEIRSKNTDPNATPTLEIENQATAVVNGQNGLGSVNGKFCMDLALKKASSAGLAMVSCYNSNHFGIASMYTLQAINKGFLGLSATNCPPTIVPTRARDATFGTNPLSFGAPGLNGDNFVLDISVAASSVEKIESFKNKNQPIPKGWALNRDGNIETDANEAIMTKKLLPLGGDEISGGYKGYGLAMMIDILCGCLSGSNYGPNIKFTRDQNGSLNIGHAFIAINPRAFAKDSESKINDLMNTLRKMPPADPNKPVLVPGDLERIHVQKVCRDGGLKYAEKQHITNEKLAKELNVAPMRFS